MNHKLLLPHKTLHPFTTDGSKEQAAILDLFEAFLYEIAPEKFGGSRVTLPWQEICLMVHNTTDVKKGGIFFVSMVRENTRNLSRDIEKLYRAEERSLTVSQEAPGSEFDTKLQRPGDSNRTIHVELYFNHLDESEGTLKEDGNWEELFAAMHGFFDDILRLLQRYEVIENDEIAMR